MKEEGLYSVFSDEKLLFSECYFSPRISFRTVGLIGKKETYSKAILLKPCKCVHTCFMRFPIDVLFINKDNIIVGRINQLKPWRFTFPRFKAHAVLEISSKISYDVKFGSRITFTSLQPPKVK